MPTPALGPDGLRQRPELDGPESGPGIVRAAVWRPRRRPPLLNEDQGLTLDDAVTPTNGRVLAGRYALHEELGVGGAGTVWRAHDRALQREVAVKLLHPQLASDEETARRFRIEATAAAKLTHPNAVVVYDLGTSDEGDYLVMELVEGATLADLLEQDRLTPGEGAWLGTMVARALGLAHTRGLVHRDVKPANVLLTPEGTAKVTDFGIARALGDATARLTSPGMVMGTARYLSPEQLRDEEIDARADVYAVGLLVHQAVTGRTPFGEGTAVEIAARRLADDLPRARTVDPGIPAGLDDVIARATSLDAGHRYPDGDALAAALVAHATPDASDRLGDRVRAGAPGAVAGIPGPSSATSSTADEAASDRPHAPPPAPGPTAAAGGSRAALTSTTTLRSEPDRRPSSRPTRDRSHGSRHGTMRWVLVATLLGALALLVPLIDVLDDTSPEQAGDEQGGDEPNASDSSEDEDVDDEDGNEDEGAGEAAAVELTDAGDHDPGGDDSQENPGEVGLAIDGDQATGWSTVTYASEEFGNLKEGVGLWVALDGPTDLDELELTTEPAGASIAVFGGDAPPEPDAQPSAWGSELASATAEDSTITVELDGEAEVLLLWITELPPGNTVDIREVGVTGS